MQLTKKRIAALVFIAVTTVVLVPGCAYDVYQHGTYPRSTVAYRPAYTYDYHYYPSTRVYFHLYSGYYYYRPYKTWLRVKRLPPSIYIGPGERVHVRIWSAPPYVRHDLHVKRFHPHPRFRRDRSRDRYERRYNRRHHQQYLRRYRH